VIPRRTVAFLTAGKVVRSDPATRLLSMMEPVVANRDHRARFIPPMLLLRTEVFPEGRKWLCDLKLDGYRAAKAPGRVRLW
jgi:ATP-dependent DNA ligase